MEDLEIRNANVLLLQWTGRATGPLHRSFGGFWEYWKLHSCSRACCIALILEHVFRLHGFTDSVTSFWWSPLFSPRQTLL